jgi:hypothetical protein
MTRSDLERQWRSGPLMGEAVMPAGIPHPAGSRTGPRQLARYSMREAPQEDGRPRCAACGAPTADMSYAEGVVARECRQCWAARWDRIWGRR